MQVRGTALVMGELRDALCLSADDPQWCWFAEEVALHYLTTRRFQHGRLAFGFHALGDRRNAERSRQTDKRRDNRA